MLRSTLTALASRMGGRYRFALEEQLLIPQSPLHLSQSTQLVSGRMFSNVPTIRSLPNTAIIAEFLGILKVAEGRRIP
jgi:hypothetical protein